MAASTRDQVASNPATLEQAAEYKEVIISHGENLIFFGFTKKSKLLKAATGDKFVWLVRESLPFTMLYCFHHPNDDMKNVAIEQFDDFLDSIIKRHEELEQSSQ